MVAAVTLLALVGMIAFGGVAHALTADCAGQHCPDHHARPGMDQQAQGGADLGKADDPLHDPAVSDQVGCGPITCQVPLLPFRPLQPAGARLPDLPALTKVQTLPGRRAEGLDRPPIAHN